MHTPVGDIFLQNIFNRFFSVVDKDDRRDKRRTERRNEVE